MEAKNTYLKRIPDKIIRACALYLILSLLVHLNMNAQWGYTIGQKEIPTAFIHKDPASFKVYPGHPRLFFRDTDIPVIQARIRGDFKPEWQEMLSDLETNALPFPATTFGEGPNLKNWTYGRNVAFVAAITGEEKYINWAKQWIGALVASGPVGNDDQYRGRLQSLAVAYDWLYSILTDVEKKEIKSAILEHIDKSWYFAERADYVGGHSRWGNFALATGILSIVTEQPELWEKLLILREHWVNGFHPLQGWIAVDGGYHMGWSYSHAYLTCNNHCVWSGATNECAYYPWQGLLPLFWLYGKQGDNKYPNTGDAYVVRGIDYNSESDLITIAAGIFKNQHAAWMVRQRPDRFADILYGDKSVKAKAPDDPASPLPLSRYFRNAGVIIARDRWDEKTTNLQFRSVPFYSANHHHRDENCFTLHYKGPLAIDAGYYDSYGSSHWDNYFTRTIAHNGIVVFDPSQKMTVYSRAVSNDGGQTYRKEPTRFNDILPGGHAHLDGITQYQDTKEYTYAAGDATKAYDPDRVKLAQREIVYLRSSLRTHPVVIIFDRVESAKPEFVKKFLLHTVKEPVINEKITLVENVEGGRLTCLTLLPEKARLQLIGGPGKEFWVDGVNYPPSRTHPEVEPGNWRLEVSPAINQTMDYFLHVLFVDDVDAKSVTSDMVKMNKDNKAVTISTAGWKIVFPYAAGEKALIEPLL